MNDICLCKRYLTFYSKVTKCLLMKREREKPVDEEREKPVDEEREREAC